MRKLLVAAMLTAAFVAPANADFFGMGVMMGGAIIAVDAAGKSFTCHRQTGDWSARTTGKTVFRLGRHGKKKATFADLKIGETIALTYHTVKHEYVADRVVIKAK